MPMIRSFLSGCLIGAVVAGHAAGQSAVAPSRSAALPPARYLDQFIDPSVSPRTDFYAYSVGKWLREHAIPKSENGWGVGDVIQEETYPRALVGLLDVRGGPTLVHRQCAAGTDLAQRLREREGRATGGPQRVGDDTADIHAYYNTGQNEIVLPAAAFILPGIDDSLVDDALAYSYAGGATIGHEITHGFDDEGRQFDERGNLQNWWTGADEIEFKRRTEGVVRQYGAYVAVGALHVNGEATAGENIADLGGLNLGWDAFTRTQQYE